MEIGAVAGFSFCSSFAASLVAGVVALPLEARLFSRPPGSHFTKTLLVSSAAFGARVSMFEALRLAFAGRYHNEGELLQRLKTNFACGGAAGFLGAVLFSRVVSASNTRLSVVLAAQTIYYCILLGTYSTMKVPLQDDLVLKTLRNVGVAFGTSVVAQLASQPLVALELKTNSFASTVALGFSGLFRRANRHVIFVRSTGPAIALAGYDLVMRLAFSALAPGLQNERDET